MELTVKVGWLLLALIHVSPAAVLFSPELVSTLYGVSPSGDVGTLLTHRGALFLAVVAVCLYAMMTPGARRAATVVVGISVLSFLWVYTRAGMPAGALRTIAIVDLAALVPLVAVTYAAWRSEAP